MLPVVAIALLAPLAAPTQTPELDLVVAYLAPTDEAVVMGDHCRRWGGADSPADLPPVPGAERTATNGFLRHHTAWHFRYLHARTLVDGEQAGASADDRYGEAFVSYHRHMIEAYDAWRAEQGAAPVEAWDPSTPVPKAFAYPVEGPLCDARVNEDPQVPFPSWATVEGGAERDPLFGYASLCEFGDLNELGKAVDKNVTGYHGRVHGGVGGDMNNALVSPREPLFWAWHKFLDHAVFRAWERECAEGDPRGGSEEVVAASADPAAFASVPGPGAGLAILGAVGAALALTRPRARP